MGTRSIYKSASGREAVLAAYDRAVAGLGVELDERVVETAAGATHVLLCGPPDGPPILSFHGGNAFNSDTLEWYLPLADTFCIYAPDTVGHPGRSAETRLDPRGLGYGEWARDVLDGLGLERAAVLGTSYGGGIALRLAAVAPERIGRAALVVPSGFVMPATWPLMVRLMWPLIKHTVAPSPARAADLLAPLFAGVPVDPEQAERTHLVSRHLRMERRMPRAATAAELAGYDGPTLVLSGERDILFPAERVLPRAHEVLEDVVAERLDGSGHFPSPAAREQILTRVREHFAAG